MRGGPSHLRVGALALAGGLALAGCHGAPTEHAPAKAVEDPSGYLSPPTLTAAARDEAGGVTLMGAAPPKTEVRLRDPDGSAYSATADDDGVWETHLSPSIAPRMFAFDGELSGRLLHGEGAILALPAPGPPIVLTRAGYGAYPIVQAPPPPVGGPVRILAIDYDGAGGGSVSGLAAPGAPVRFVLDGVAVGVGEADAHGRFTVMDLNVGAPFHPGPHAIRIESRSVAVEGDLTVTPPAQLGDAPFLANRQAGAWRIDWLVPGGGQQTTVVFDLPPASPAAPEGPKP